MNKTQQLLTEAKSLIDTPDKWTQEGVLALDENGFYVDPTNLKNNPCKMCVLGAVGRADVISGNGVGELPLENSLAILYRESGERTGGNGVGVYNDAPTTTHEDIMNLFDRAIERAGEKDD